MVVLCVVRREIVAMASERSSVEPNVFALSGRLRSALARPLLMALAFLPACGSDGAAGGGGAPNVGGAGPAGGGVATGGAGGTGGVAAGGTGGVAAGGTGGVATGGSGGVATGGSGGVAAGGSGGNGAGNVGGAAGYDAGAMAGALGTGGNAGSAGGRQDAAVGDGGVADGLPYYRLRIEFLDQGDWTTLAIVDPSKVIKVRQMSVTGTPNVLSVEKNQLGLNTNFGSDLKVVADYAITPSAIDTPFQFSLTKGGAGTVTIRIYAVVDGNAQLIKEIPKQAQQLAFSVDLSSLKGVAPILAPLAPVKNMGLALYYPWYSLDNWSNPVLKDHPATPYASNDPTAIDRQMDQAKSAGINAFTVSWIGPDSSSDKNFKIMLTEAAKKGFYLGFFLETTGGDLPNNTQRAIDWLSYISSQYSSNPNVLKVAGKPVVTPWLTNLITPATWASIRAGVRAKGQDVWLMSDKQETEYIDVMDGVRYSGSIAGLGEKIRYYSVLADNPAPKLWIGTVMPGFDERNLSDRGPNPRFIDRTNGAYFTGQLDDVFKNSPQWVLVDTWNEWYENTYIEPSVNYGDQYLQIAARYLKNWVQQ
jgi:hypothetical protein